MNLRPSALLLVIHAFASVKASKHWKDWDMHTDNIDNNLLQGRCEFLVQYDTEKAAFPIRATSRCVDFSALTPLDGSSVAQVTVPVLPFKQSTSKESHTVHLNGSRNCISKSAYHITDGPADEGCFTYPTADGATSVTFFKQENTVTGIAQDISNSQMVVECDCSMGGAGGDPHIQTWTSDKQAANRHFFMGECDSVLYTSRDFDQGMGLDVHIRTTAREFYSFIEAAAVLVGNTVIEMSIGNTGMFYVDGVLKTDFDLPMTIEGKYVLDKVATLGERGSSYMLNLHNVAIELRILNFMMSVNLIGDRIDMNDSAGMMGSYPSGIAFDRRGSTIFEADDELANFDGDAYPVKNSFGLEWQVRPGRDPQLFRQQRAPIWPNKCRFPTNQDKFAATESRKLLETVEIKAASEACVEHTDVDSSDFELCVLDVLAFNDVAAAAAW